MAPKARLSQLQTHLSAPAATPITTATRHNSSTNTPIEPQTIPPSIHLTTHRHSSNPNATIATITVSNPSRINIVNSSLLTQLTTTCKSLVSDPSLRAVILTGARAPDKAASFIGGADIKEMASLDSPESAREFILKIHEVCEAIREIPVPVIARVNGFSLGAGLEIMTSCDLRVATKGSVFGMPEVKVGIPSVVEAALLPGQIGWGRTRRFLYLAEIIDVVEAEKWGLVERVVDSDDERALDEAVEEWVDKLVEAGPEAIRSQKRLMQKWEGMTLQEGVMAGVEAFAESWRDGGREPKEMMERFLNRNRKR